MSNLRKAAVALAVTGALGMAGGAVAAPIQFDRDGGGAGTGAISATTFNWAAANVLLQNLVKSTTLAGVEVANPGGAFTLYAQGTLGSITRQLPAGAQPSCLGATCGLVGGEITFQMGLSMAVTGSASTVGTTTSFSADIAAAPAVNFFRIYFDAANNANDLTGAGYGDGTLILQGTLTDIANGINMNLALNQNNTQNSSTANSGLRKLDNFQADNRPGIGTYVGDGSMQFDIQVTSQNLAFFQTGLTSLTVGMNLSTPIPLPFSQTNPSAAIVGFAPVYGTNTQTGVFTSTSTGPAFGQRIMNDFRCGTGANGSQRQCDTHVQGQGLSSFFAIPEPGSVALVGLGLGLLGLTARRRRTV